MTSMPNFKCECCSFECNLKTDYNRHILSAKHVANSKKETEPDIKTIIEELKTQFEERLAQQEKHYESRLTEQEKHYESRLTEQKDIINKLIERPQAVNPVYQSLAKLPDKPSFNVESFLNDECKDAMNIIEFKNSLVVREEQMLDLLNADFKTVLIKIIREHIEKIGGKFKRPIHVTDKSRNVKYIKDENNKWIIEDDKQKLLCGLANKISFDLMKLSSAYGKKNYSKKRDTDDSDDDDDSPRNRNDNRVANIIGIINGKIELDNDKLLKQLNSLKNYCYIKE